MRANVRAALQCLLFSTLPLGPRAAAEPPDPLPRYWHDRGAGVRTSMFGTYVRKGEWLVYPFYEYYRDGNFEYSPANLGLSPLEADFRGRSHASEGLLFVARGLSDSVAVEFEAALIRSALTRSALDPVAGPRRIEESGLGDVEGQITWRWLREGRSRPEFFSYTSIVAPHHREKHLIGTADWQFKVGTGVTRGFSWGTLTARGSVEYDRSSSSRFDLGEMALEYLKRVSPRCSVYVGLEGTPDELSAIGELQWRIRPNVTLKLNNGFGLTSRAADWAPEVGVVFAFPGRH